MKSTLATAKLKNLLWKFTLLIMVGTLGVIAPKPGFALERKPDEIDLGLEENQIMMENHQSNPTMMAQGSEVLVNTDKTGVPPTLETEPSTPQEFPFEPQNLPLLPQETLLSPRRYQSAPNITIITPSGYGKFWRNVSVGFGLQERTRFSQNADGVLGMSFGLGNPHSSVGLDVGVTITDLDTAQDGTISLKLHRQLGDGFAVSVGVLNAVDWGLTDGGRSFYGAVTKRFRLRENVEEPFSQFYVSAGVGDGQFRSESDVQANIDSVGVFGSVAVRVAEPVNAIAEWTGQDLTVGLSVVPFQNLPLVITPAVTDITGNAGDGSRFILGIGYLISF